MSNTNAFEDVRLRFESLLWHDSELRGIILDYSVAQTKRNEPCKLSIRVDLRAKTMHSEGEVLVPTELRFLRPRFFSADVDLLGVSYCGGDISSVECSEVSKFMQRFISETVPNFNLPQDEQSLATLKHFGIYLCNPSGQINIVAEDFELVKIETK